MRLFHYTGQRRPAASHQHTHLPQRRDAVAYDHALHGQHAQAYYPQLSSARPTNSEYGPYMDRHDFDYQQYNPRHIDDSETSSTAAVVGSQAPQPSFAPPQPYHDFRTTTRAGDPYIQPARVEHQQGLPMNHSVPYGGTNGPALWPYHGPSYRHGGQVEYLMSQGAPFMPILGPMLMPHNRPQAWFEPAQSMQIHPPAMYAPAPTVLPTNYSGMPTQPRNVNALYPARYQPCPQPPANVSSGDLSNNAVNLNQYPRVNNDNAVDSTSIAPGATRPPRKNHRGGKNGKVKFAGE